MTDYYEQYEEELTPEEIEQNAELQLEEWRNQYTAVYLTEIEDVQIIWRGLSRAEFRKVVEAYEDEFERAEAVARLCVLDPQIEDWSNEIYAGVPEILARNILRESGFSEEDTKIQSLMTQYDGEMETFDNQVSCIIKEAFPDISLEAIEDWPLERTMWYLSRAKWTLKTFRGVNMEKEEEAPGQPG